MYSLKNDYSEGAHPKILEAIVKTNLEQSEGYGKDTYCEKASELIKEKLKNDNVDIHFLCGGTQTNLTAISAFLRPYEAVISANTGHILVHETGAIESTGHKVISVDSTDGKLKKEDILSVLKEHTDEHMVKPKLVYISNSTEIGTIYTKSELEELSYVCRKNNLLLYMDGARLGSALCVKENDLTLSEISYLTDAFYIGGTKNGALFGEALVICKDSLKEEFRFNIKQKGAMMAKSRLLGIQFLELFKDDLFFEIGKHENDMADILKKEISELGYKFLVDSPSNQLFPIFKNEIIEKLEEDYSFSLWSGIDENSSCIRLVTSWATQKENVIKFIEDLKKYSI
ncbi:MULTISPECIES: threonine aldolase family protein [unclassified Romboutsia]|uniref:threonine aldolase family protein n=1 Tax=unclassified Romboutsia TaxID=2626894 RepID=UPI00189A81BD|nr:MULTISPECIES: low specificity L-threonine aldolase [unclassified Romboutsia]MDB8805927.1 low specificity L-threonine aldolase [Romboutsia sp. 1001216sp1]MDB8807629.1 low specificity L-threonine aldolase [Romboutsia sp. 1001216sp1]MDB8811252.1 low specificity L-threonine aldolase [Romboutsia sp. 1001216sp1]MDB8816972.1 low specificity L-threonine aldolase [Romboutsia sp. 1001216sp1]MDB8819510.1 low specificity L-threonine aldolase [Romboutsia sp. 1001216sp1]